MKNLFLAFSLLALASCAKKEVHIARTFDIGNLGNPTSENDAIPEGYLSVSQLDEQPKILIKPNDNELRLFDFGVLDKIGSQTIDLEILVNENGEVVKAIVRNSEYGMIAETMRRIARTARYSPGFKDGHPVKWHAKLPITLKK
ncbi:hypothetical protein [Pelagicoccus sp. SDUM812003]|uniref:hypothetical protein n=1 Tax=Pelagicoccus sp. SDUM812003 TaxID=3041267 RepID=UPI00280EBFA7|nr:hypothetical protein [Pelagicoccus sp. SDUM812003]MDQ8205787.1 hypothetical protein [Pelagicoccus sp. SDUM812003]